MQYNTKNNKSLCNFLQYPMDPMYPYFLEKQPIPSTLDFQPVCSIYD